MSKLKRKVIKKTAEPAHAKENIILHKMLTRTVSFAARKWPYIPQENLTPLVTIGVLAYNAEPYIRQTIESILNQTEQNFELIIRDNGSSDQTGEIIMEYAAEDCRIIFLSNKVNYLNNDGTPLGEDGYNVCSDGYVCGKSRGPGKYFTILDSDDLLHPQYLEKLCQKAEEYEADMVICGSYFFIDGEHKICSHRYPPDIVFHKTDTLSVNDFIHLYGCLRPQWGKIYNYQFYEKYYSENMELNRKEDIGQEGDTLMCFSYLKKALCFIAINNAYHFYREKQIGTVYYQGDRKERIVHYGSLFRHGASLADYFQIPETSIRSFLFQVYLRSILDLFKMPVESSEIKIRFMNMDFIFKDRIYAAYADLENGVIPVLGNIHTLLKANDFNPEPYFENISAAMTIVFYNSGHLPEAVCMAALFILILDKRNPYMIGISLLNNPGNKKELYRHVLLTQDLDKKREFIIQELTSYCRSCKELYDTPVFCQTKVKILDVIEAGDLETADAYTDSLLEQIPYDREALYYKIYLSFMKKDMLKVEIYTLLGLFFWKKDEEMMELLSKIWNLRKEQ